MSTLAAAHPGTIIAEDGTTIFYNDWGTGQPVVFSHGWPLMADAFEDQMAFLASTGYRTIAHDRRGHGRSSQPWHGNDMDTYADDLATLMDTLDIRNAVLVGHSTGGGEVVRYIGRHGTDRVAKVVLISAIPPLLVRTEKNPDGIPMEEFDRLRASIAANRADFMKEFGMLFYGYNRPNVMISEGVLDTFWRQTMMSSYPAMYFCVKAFSETDLTADLEKIDVPTLLLHGEDDQVVPIDITSRRSVEIIPDAKLKSYPGLPHGLCTTHKDVVNADLLEFIASG